MPPTPQALRAAPSNVHPPALRRWAARGAHPASGRSAPRRKHGARRGPPCGRPTPCRCGVRHGRASAPIHGVRATTRAGDGPAGGVARRGCVRGGRGYATAMRRGRAGRAIRQQVVNRLSTGCEQVSMRKPRLCRIIWLMRRTLSLCRIIFKTITIVSPAELCISPLLHGKISGSARGRIRFPVKM